MNQTMIDVGIMTDGAPRIHSYDGYTMVENVLIGKGFHWQQSIQCRFPGEIFRASEEVRPYTLINRLPLESYLECVVASEMNPKAPKEFLRAHAIVSRSWAAGKISGIKSKNPFNSLGKIREKERIIDWEDTEDHIEFHLCNDDHCQRYQGLQDIPREAQEAITDTAGLVITDSNGDLIDARFSKCCGGRTEIFSTCWQNEERPGLETFEDPWCDLTSLSPNDRKRLLESVLKSYDMSSEGGFRWERQLDSREIRQLIKQRYNKDLGKIVNLHPLETGMSGRIKELEIEGSEAMIVLGKELAIRRSLSHDCLYSSAFRVVDIIDNNNRRLFKISGKGWGHGVGMCQIGAANMALNGYSAEEILSFYYPHTRIVLLENLHQTL